MPGESRELSPGGFYLIKQTLDQSNQQAANHVDQHCPEKVRHRLDLLSENMPTGWTIPVSQAEGNAVSLPSRLATLDERLNNAHKGREESTRIPSSPVGHVPRVSQRFAGKSQSLCPDESCLPLTGANVFSQASA